MYLDLANAPIRSYKMDDLKTRLLRPALTSHYQCWFNPPGPVRGWISARRNGREDTQNLIGRNGLTSEEEENLSISCCDASLPGSTFQTHDVMAYAGVNEKFAYMRAYDDRSDFTFYVNEQYLQLQVFEDWMAYICDEQSNQNVRGGFRSKTYNYRMNFPEKYRTDITIAKFERNFGGEKIGPTQPEGRTLKYNFVDAYPISIASIPVSYNSSELLKCTVSFTYSRYYLTSNVLGGVSINPGSTTPGTTNTTQGVTPATIGQDLFNTLA